MSNLRHLMARSPIIVAAPNFVQNLWPGPLVDEDFGPLFIKFASYFPGATRQALPSSGYWQREMVLIGR